jgi:hypothetical protein
MVESFEFDLSVDGLPCIACGAPATHRTPDLYPICDDCGPDDIAPNPFEAEIAAANANMTPDQRRALARLCERYGVDFDEHAYQPAFDLPTGWLAGTVGPIYVGCSPEGEIHS